VEQNKDVISAESLAGVAVFILPAPKNALEPEELMALTGFMAGGGGLLVMAGEGKEEQSYHHLNKLTEEFGITVNHDSIVRTVYHQEYYHPKEAYIKSACLVRELDKVTPL
jgi:intraflagellar transport protein 52